MKTFKDYLMNKIAGEPAGMGDDLAPGAGGNLPDFKDQPPEDVQEDPSFAPTEDTGDDTAIMTEFIQNNPDLIRSLGGVDAIIEALKKAAGEDQGMQENIEQTDDNSNELGNKLESILNPTDDEQSPEMAGQVDPTQVPRQ